LKRTVRPPPTWSEPVGLGAKRTRTVRRLGSIEEVDGAVVAVAVIWTGSSGRGYGEGHRRGW
jgi:hypothetical protein